MSSAKKAPALTFVQYDTGSDAVDQDAYATEIVDRGDCIRVTVHPQPLLARNTSGRRNYFMPRCESEWIYMVNRANGGAADGSFYLPPGTYGARLANAAHIARSISANSYFDPYSLPTVSSNRNQAESTNKNNNTMSRHQMERAYQRVCSEKSSNRDWRARSMSLKFPQGFGDPGDSESPILTTRPVPLVARSCSVSTDRTRQRKLGEGITSQSTPAKLDGERAKTALPDKAPTDLLLGDILLPLSSSPPRGEVNWGSALYRYDRAKIVKKSPPWRSLLNRRPQGFRAAGGLCPNHCRCCFEKSYDTAIKDVFKLDA